jgi:hypothetical protein
MSHAFYSYNNDEYTGGLVEIVPQPGSSLAKGTYNDTVTVTVCLDPACVNPVGPPLTIVVQYTVSDTQTVPGPNGYTFQILPLHTTDIAWDATHGLFYLSTSPDAANGASALRTLDPGTLTLGARCLSVTSRRHWPYPMMVNSSTWDSPTSAACFACSFRAWRPT